MISSVLDLDSKAMVKKTTTELKSGKGRMVEAEARALGVLDLTHASISSYLSVSCALLSSFSLPLSLSLSLSLCVSVSVSFSARPLSLGALSSAQTRKAARRGISS